MAQGNSGSFTLTGSQNFAVIIYWSETYNESANTHVVSITAAQLVSPIIPTGLSPSTARPW